MLDTLDTVKICVGYECDGKTCDTVPASARLLERCKPVYEEMRGWRTSIRNVRRFDDLPREARDYVDRLCELAGVPVGLLSLGPSRQSTIKVRS